MRALLPDRPERVAGRFDALSCTAARRRPARRNQTAVLGAFPAASVNRASPTGRGSSSIWAGIPLHPAQSGPAPRPRTSPGSHEHPLDTGRIPVSKERRRDSERSASRMPVRAHRRPPSARSSASLPHLTADHPRPPRLHVTLIRPSPPGIHLIRVGRPWYHRAHDTRRQLPPVRHRGPPRRAWRSGPESRGTSRSGSSGRSPARASALPARFGSPCEKLGKLGGPVAHA